MQPNRMVDLVGRVARRDLGAGEFFFDADLLDEGVTARNCKFRRPSGFPVRYHDYRELSAHSNPEFLEFHMSYRDVELSWMGSYQNPSPLVSSCTALTCSREITS